MTISNLPENVRIVEVGPRDGLQNERVRLSVEQNVMLIELLAKAGMKDIEAGSFVHPKWIPQMANTAQVFKRIKKRKNVRYWALVPNMRGLENAIKVGVTHVAVFVSSSESHNKSNINRTIDETLAQLKEVLEVAKKELLTTRAYISTVFGCPYEGKVDFKRVMEITDFFLQTGVSQVSLGDTTGMGNPLQIRKNLNTALDRFHADKLALHLHDTRGLGLANAFVGLEAGITTFDTSIGGMGGCPYAPGASGNLGSEDLIHMLDVSDIKTNINIESLLKISRLLEFDYGTTLNSRFYRSQLRIR